MRTIPVATSKTKYRTLDERCAACRVYGGREDPCVGPKILAKIQEEHGRPCPRVELAPGNIAAANLIVYLCDRDLQPLALAMYEATVESEAMTPEDRLTLLGRVSAAVHDEEVANTLHPRRPGSSGLPSPPLRRR